jgi:hypothetical protein
MKPSGSGTLVGSSKNSGIAVPFRRQTLAPETGEAACGVALYGSGTNLKRDRSLRIRQSQHVAMNEDFPLPARQALERPLQV